MDIFSLVGKITINYSDAVNNIEKVSKSAKDTAETLEDVDKKADGAGDSVEDAGQAAKNADGGFSTWKATLANLASNVITKAVTGCTNLAKSVVDLGTDFTSTMSEVQAISGASDEQMKQLEATARQFGATTVFSANDAAEALKYMSLAGWSVEQSTSALGGVLDLAAASGMELGQASDMVTDYLSAFGLEADKAAYFADLLSYAQSHSNTTAEQLGEAYRNCAANLNAAGQDVETTTSLLEAMANQGYKGSEAGTALTAIMRDVTNAMKDGNIQIGDTTISVMDANGNFRDLTDILTDVESATDGMGDAQRAAALSSTFTADSTKGLNLILNEGMEKVAGYEEALRNSDGAASDMAATMNDNLKGDLANLNSAFEELKLKIFDGAESPMRSVVQFITSKVIPAITKLVENMDTVAPIVAGIVTSFVTLKATMAISSLISAITASWKAYKAANEGATIAQWLFNAALNANPIVLIISLIAGLVVALVLLWNTNDGFREAVTNAWEKIKEVFGNVIDAIKGFFSGLVEKVQTAWESVKEAVSTAIEAIKGFFTGLVDSIKQAWENIKTAISEKIDAIKETVTNVFTAIADTVSAVWETIKNAVQVAIMFIGEIISAAFQIITIPFQFIWENCKEYIIAAWEFIKNAVSTALDAISTTISNIWNAIVGFLTPILEGIKNTFTTIWEAIKTAVSTAINAIQTVITTVWNAIVSFLKPILEGIKNTFTTVWNAIKSTISTVLNAIQTAITTVWNAIKTTVTNVINSIKSVISSVFNAIKSTISSILNSIKSTFTSVWNSIKSTVSNVINGVKSTISSGLNAAKSVVSNVLGAIKDKFSSIFEGAKNIVSNAINKIKSFFNFSWSLPKLKLPHFSISGSFSLSPPSVPHFSIDWYKKAMDDGMIMNQPTIFGYNAKSNQFMAGGEAGSETVVGTQSLMDMIRVAVNEENASLLEKLDRILAILESYMPFIPQLANLKLVTDTGVLAGELAPAMDEELGKIFDRKGR